MSLRDDVLDLLLRSDGTYCSGGNLAEQLGVSRTAIWKAIEHLKAEGADISAVTRRGYRLETMPDLFSETYFRSLVRGCRIDWKPQFFAEVGSTNDLAKELAAKGAPEGTVVLADKQLAGKGRLGKRFHSPEGGLGMYMSLVLRPTSLPLSDMMAVTACTASAVHEALQEFGVTAQIKWVNDLFLNGRKICGILSEGSFNAELLSMDHLVIGIGVNLHPDAMLPEELRSIVTDVETETGIYLRRFELAAAILRHLEHLMDELPQRTYLHTYRAHSMTIGRRIRVSGRDGEMVGTAVGYEDDAGLIVELDDGSRETIRTGSAVFVN